MRSALSTILLTTTVTFACTQPSGTNGTAKKTPEAATTTRPTSAATKAPPKKTRLPLGSAISSVDVSMKNIDGKMLSLADVRKDKGTLVIFTCNHCPYAKAWEDRIAKIGNEAQTKGVGVIAINPNDPASFPEDSFENMKQRASKAGFQFPYVVDATSNVARAYGATKTPEVFLFGPDEKLIYYGAVDDSAEESGVESRFLKDAIEAMLAGQPIKERETKAVGCSIKFRS